MSFILVSMVSSLTSIDTLGNFLRAQRERLEPDGTMTKVRRRTPGLRREEVAARAGMSAIWYMRIEQGKAEAVSAPTLARIAEALELAPAERAHLFHLAGRSDPVAPPESGRQVPDALRRCVGTFGGPAYVLDRLWNVAAANDDAIALFGDWIGRGENLLRFVFLSDEARGLIDDWPGRAQRLLAEFRLDHGRRSQDADMAALVDTLRTESPECALWWREQQVLDREGGLRRFNHPGRGLLTFDQLTLVPAGNSTLKLVLLFPDQSESMISASTARQSLAS